MSGTNASAPKKAPASSPRIPIVAGSPAANRTVPRGSSRCSAGPSRASPTTASTAPTQSSRCPASCSAVTPTAAATAARLCPVRGGPSAPSASCGPGSRGSSSHAAGSTSTGTPRKTSRQVRWSATAPATTGPTTDGSTQAADMAANTRGLRPGSYDRPTTT